MQITEENIKALSGLGLSTNQAKIYLCVLRAGGMSFQDIAKMTKIRREDIYKTVPKLEQLGLTERTLGHPAMLKPLPVEIALAHIIKLERNGFATRMTALEKSTSDFVKRYRNTESKPTEAHENEGNFALITEKNAIVNKGEEMISIAKEEIDAMYSETKLAQFVPLFAEPLRKACNEGIGVRLVAEKKASTGIGKKIIQESLRNCKTLDLRYADRPTSHCVIIDHKQALSATLSTGYFAESPHLWTDNKGIVQLLALNFESIWEAASPASLA